MPTHTVEIEITSANYSWQPLIDCARRLLELPVWLVGVRCPLDVIVERRRNTWGVDESEGIPLPIQLWQREVHIPGIYDVEVDTSLLSPDECARRISRNMSEGPEPSAIERLAAMDQNG